MDLVHYVYHAFYSVFVLYVRMQHKCSVECVVFDIVKWDFHRVFALVVLCSGVVTSLL